MPLVNHDDYREDLAAALRASDLARIQAFPASLLLRADAYIPGRSSSFDAAPFACAIDIALNALNKNMRLPPLPTTTTTESPTNTAIISNLAAQLVDDGDAAGAAFAVVDWLLEQFPALLNMPMDTVRYNGYGGASYTTQTPMLQTLSHFTRALPYEAIALLDRLLRLGASTQPPPVAAPHGSQGFKIHMSVLCFAMDTASLPAGAHAVRRLIAAGARLAPGEAPLAVQRALFALGAVNAPGGQRFKGARALRTLLPLLRALAVGVAVGDGQAKGVALARAERGQAKGIALGSKGEERSGIFETLEEQERAAGVWLRDSEAAPETLDALLQLGLRLEVVRRVVGPTAAAPPRSGAEALRLAEEAAAERAMRTLAVRGLRERLPLEIVSDIARRASADAPSWQLALGPMMMDPPLLRGSGSVARIIAAADARAAAAARRRAAPP